MIKLVFTVIFFGSLLMPTPQDIQEITLLVHKIAPDCGVNPRLVLGVIKTESSFRVNAYRYEEGFYKKYISGKSLDELPGKYPKGEISESSEKILRSSSMGLMQVMGQTARELGYEDNLTELIKNPEVNITLGCKLLSKLLKKKNGIVRDALLAYNGGSNLKYPDTVFRNMEK